MPFSALDMHDHRTSRLLAHLAFAVLGASSVGLPAHAQNLAPTWAFAQAGGNADAVGQAGAGVAWPLAWTRQALGGEFGARVELSLSYWRAPAFGGGKQGFVHLELVPVLRYRFDAGRSPWFVEGGIGLVAANKRYVTPDKTFSTRLNFSDNLAVGRSFGEGWNQELSLRLQHTSNAGIKKPNPGEDLLMVRYARHF